MHWCASGRARVMSKRLTRHLPRILLSDFPQRLNSSKYWIGLQSLFVTPRHRSGRAWWGIEAGNLTALIPLRIDSSRKFITHSVAILHAFSKAAMSELWTRFLDKGTIPVLASAFHSFRAWSGSKVREAGQNVARLHLMSVRRCQNYRIKNLAYYHRTWQPMGSAPSRSFLPLNASNLLAHVIVRFLPCQITAIVVSVRG
jgi:hypothetical protein